MAVNEVYRDADHLSLPVPAGTASGAPVLVGALPGVAVTDRDTDGYASVWLTGAFRLTVDGPAITVIGNPVYVTPAGVLTSDDDEGANTLFGHALAAKAAGPADITVRIAAA